MRTISSYHKTYDFTDVLESLYAANAAEQKGPMDEMATQHHFAKLIRDVFPMADLSRYTALFLQGDFRPEYKPHLNGPVMPTRETSYSGIDSYKTYRQPPQPGMEGRRPAHEFMLTEDETRRADGVIKQSLLMQETITAMQAILVNYCDGLIELNRETYETRDPKMYGQVSGILTVARKFASTFTMRYDLMPVIALAVEQSGWKKGDELNEDHFRRGLGLAFAKQSFRTVDMSAANPERREARCPFSPIMAEWMAKIPTARQDGQIDFYEDESRQGALPAFVAARIQNLSAQSQYIPDVLFDL